MNLRRRVDDSGIVAQHLKRLPSIITKLERLDWVRLPQMQDIGGCRAVVGSAGEAFRLAADFVDSRIRHELVSHSNYIDRPRRTGYRSLHMVYSYHSDRTDIWNGLKTEIQVRSQLQHQWATAVETVGTFLGDSLKSGVGNQDWLRFFALMSSVIAGHEGTAAVPDTPAGRSELVAEIREHDRRLGISDQLTLFQEMVFELQGIRNVDNHWFGIELNLNAYEIVVLGFDANNWASANEWYAERELEVKSPYVVWEFVNPFVLIRPQSAV
ncbi:MAG: RelA/SpoT domain-containing protein [Dehalococcoidia bacterium]|nr:RelA/SpoT domain-containing protein [Dehalococcoidia bacterium]